LIVERVARAAKGPAAEARPLPPLVAQAVAPGEQNARGSSKHPGRSRPHDLQAEHWQHFEVLC
jgi:hypothetical protein